MGNSNAKDRAIQVDKAQLFQDAYTVVTISLVPHSDIPPGIRLACVGDGDLLGNWQADHAIAMTYKLGTCSTSFVIPSAAKDMLEFSFLLQCESNQTFVCSESGGRHSLKEASSGRCANPPQCATFQVPASAGRPGPLVCTLRVSLDATRAQALANSHKGPQRAYFESQGPMSESSTAAHDAVLMLPPTRASDSPMSPWDPAPIHALAHASGTMSVSPGGPRCRHTKSNSISWKEFVMITEAQAGSLGTSHLDTQTDTTSRAASPLAELHARCNSSSTHMPESHDGGEGYRDPSSSLDKAETGSSAADERDDHEGDELEELDTFASDCWASSPPGFSTGRRIMRHYTADGVAEACERASQDTDPLRAVLPPQLALTRTPVPCSSPSVASPAPPASHARPPLHPASTPTSAQPDSPGAGPADRPSSSSGVLAAHLSSRARRRLAIVLVGLPARGKTFTSRKLARYLRWMGHVTKHFNVGNYRREISDQAADAAWFDSSNEEAANMRNLAAKLCMQDMLRWMEEGGQVGIYDATNSTMARRNMLQEMCRGKCKVVFLETISNDPKLIAANIDEKIANSADYVGMDTELARADFLSRIKKYEEVYEPIGHTSGPTKPGGTGTYIKLIDTASGSGHVQVNRIQGYLPGRIVSFLLNISYSRRSLYISRHGETNDNMNGVLGGDGSLSGKGEEFAQNLNRFIESLPPSERPQSVWISSLKRTGETAKYLRKIPKVYWRVLDELDAGICDGMTYAKIKEEMPQEYEARQTDKLRYRYPRGESYLDVIQRLESVIVELERQSSPVLVIAHQAVVRCLYAYIMDKEQDEIPYIEMPLHKVICLKPGIYNTVESRFHLGPDVNFQAAPSKSK